MEDKYGFLITNRDRVFNAWENSMELVRDYQAYAQEIQDDKSLSELFSRFAEDEAVHSSKLLEILKKCK